MLSPFVVSQDSEKGCLATETLNGTRINTSLNDVGAPMSIFTANPSRQWRVTLNGSLRNPGEIFRVVDPRTYMLSLAFTF